MAEKEKRYNWYVKKGNNTNLLRAGVVALSIVSYFTTANGMKEYIFKNDSMIAYAASAAIQGILLALSMNLPRYILDICSKRSDKSDNEDSKWYKKWLLGIGRFLIKIILVLLILLLTLTTLFCSSWFSYVYIAEVIHQDSWGVDSELLVQQTYREELYSARDYAHAYRIYLEDSVGEEILAIEEQAKTLSDGDADLRITWETERENYVLENDTIVSSYMSVVIDAMEKAMIKGASQESRDLAVTSLTNAKENMTNRKESIQQNLDNLNENITEYNVQITNLTNRINRAAEGTDISSLSESLNSYIQTVNELTQRQANLQMEDMQLDSAYERLTFYESLLGLSNSTSAISIRTKLLQLQSEFFKPEADEENMLETATDIFGDLRKAATASSNENSENSLSYSKLLVQMNRLVQKLTEHSEMKEIEANLEELIVELRVINENEKKKEASQGTDNAAEQQEGGETSEGEKKEGEKKDGEKENEQWKNEWKSRLAELKGQISSMPVYSGGREQQTETQLILENYDRNASGRALDELTRRYTSKHNAIYNGIIYLQSPYRGLALFALILALAFDLSGFVFGLAVLGEKEEDEKKDVVAPERRQEKADEAEWSVIKTLKSYIVLTGDYESRDGNYYYNTFKDGEPYCWEAYDTEPYAQGIYIKEDIDNVRSKASPLPENGQNLIFMHQTGGPEDGIYRECRLIFDEGGLILVQEGQEEQKTFLGSIDEYTPVHIYIPDLGINRTIPAKKLAAKNFHAKTAVVALNDKGTSIAAIYMIEGEKKNIDMDFSSAEKGEQSMSNAMSNHKDSKVCQIQ